MNTVAWTAKAVKQLLKLGQPMQGRIRDAAGGLSDFPETPNVKRLTNHTSGYRLRVGDIGCCSISMVR